MPRAVRTWALLVCTAALTACGSKPIHIPFSADNKESISIDAKQRALYVLEKKFGNTSWKAICAEPSPDALTALSTSTSLDAATTGRALGIALASQESAAGIGLRTQTITILRDAMYRLCEGYASNALDEIGFQRLQRRYQALVLGLLAIEQLTGAVVAQQPVLGGRSGAQLGQSLAQVSVMVNKARADEAQAKVAASAAREKSETAKKTLTGKLTALDAAKKAAGDDAENAALKTAQQEHDTASANAVQAQAASDESAQQAILASAEVQSLETLRKEMDRGSAFAIASGQFTTASQRGAPGDAGIETVAKHVEAIVTTIVKQDYTLDTCMDTMTSRVANKLDTDVFEVAVRFCGQVLMAGAGPDASAARAKSAQSFNDAIGPIFDRMRKEKAEGPSTTGQPATSR